MNGPMEARGGRASRGKSSSFGNSPSKSKGGGTRSRIRALNASRPGPSSGPVPF